MENQIAIGVDIGGSHVSCAAYNPEQKALLTETFSESDLDNHAEADQIIEVWGKTIKASIEKVTSLPVMGIGFAMPGPYDYENGISQFTGQNGKYENTFGLNVPEKIRDYLGLDEGFKVRFINDASAFAIGEDRAGATRGYSRSLAITLGTGFGSAFIKDALPVVEGAEVPETGGLWHLPFEGSIADDYFSTRGLCGRYKSLTGDHVAGVKEIADLATGDNPHAKSLFTDFGTKLGLFLSPWLRKFKVEAMVIGGNISNAYPLFETGLLTYLSNEQIDLKVFISELKESASFIGSATLIDDAFYGKVLPSIRKM